MSALKDLVEAVAREKGESAVAAARAELELFASSKGLAEDEQRLWAFVERARGMTRAECEAVEESLLQVLAKARNNEASVARAEAAEQLLENARDTAQTAQAREAVVVADNAALLNAALEASSAQGAAKLKAQPHPGAALLQKLEDSQKAITALVGALHLIRNQRAQLLSEERAAMDAALLLAENLRR